MRILTLGTCVRFDARVTPDASAYGRFRRALDRGNPLGAEAAVHELPRLAAPRETLTVVAFAPARASSHGWKSPVEPARDVGLRGCVSGMSVSGKARAAAGA